MRASLALAERKPDELKAAMEKLGQEAPSSRQLFMLRIMGIVMPRAGHERAGCAIRGILLLVAAVILLLAVGFGIAKLIALPFGGVGTGPAIFFGLLIVVAALGVLVLLGRRRQARAQSRPSRRLTPR